MFLGTEKISQKKDENKVSIEMRIKLYVVILPIIISIFMIPRNIIKLTKYIFSKYLGIKLSSLYFKECYF